MRWNENELQKLTKAVADAKAARARLAAEAEKLDADERDLDELSADEYFGTAEPHVYERRRADLDARRREVSQAIERADRDTRTLAERAAQVAERQARAREAAIEEEIETRLARAEELRAQAVAEEAAVDDAQEALALAHAENRAAVAAIAADYDPGAAAQARRDAQQRKERVEWFARHAATARDQWPVELRHEIEAEVERLKAEHAAAQERLAEQAWASRKAVGGEIYVAAGEDAIAWGTSCSTRTARPRWTACRCRCWTGCSSRRSRRCTTRRAGMRCSAGSGWSGGGCPVRSSLRWGRSTLDVDALDGAGQIAVAAFGTISA